MLKIKNTRTYGWEPAIRGMRNPMNSWESSDTWFFQEGEHYDINGNSGPANGYDTEFDIGHNDAKLMKSLAKAGTSHRKFMRMITVYADITAPLYWWKEFDTYKVGTVANSCSTMHKIASKEFTLNDFSHEHLLSDSVDFLKNIIAELENYRYKYLNADTPELKKTYWWQMIQLLPSSYNQKRTVMLNYEVLANIYNLRRNHKLDEWCDFCKWIESLPYSNIITINAQEEE